MYKLVQQSKNIFFILNEKNEKILKIKFPRRRPYCVLDLINLMETTKISLYVNDDIRCTCRNVYIKTNEMYRYCNFLYPYSFEYASNEEEMYITSEHLTPGKLPAIERCLYNIGNGTSTVRIRESNKVCVTLTHYKENVFLPSSIKTILDNTWFDLDTGVKMCLTPYIHSYRVKVTDPSLWEKYFGKEHSSCEWNCFVQSLKKFPAFHSLIN